MNDQNKNKDSAQVLKSRLIKGRMPPLGDLSNVIAAQKEIAKLPYGSQDPKAEEIARKYGLNNVPG